MIRAICRFSMIIGVLTPVVRADQVRLSDRHPGNPLPDSGHAAARTALPPPPNTSQNVPTKSAATSLPVDMFIPLSQ